MRLAPLIPLAILGVGILATESLRLGSTVGSTTAPLLLVRQASVNANSEQSTISFAAGKLEIGITGTQATDVTGQIDTQGLQHRFTASNIEQKSDTTNLILDGTVELWHGDFHMRTNHAVIDRSGKISGDKATVNGPQGQAQANSFAIGEDGSVRLNGNVRALITNTDE